MGSSGDIMMTKQPKFGGEREGGIWPAALTERLGRRAMADLICMVGRNITLFSCPHFQKWLLGAMTEAYNGPG